MRYSVIIYTDTTSKEAADDYMERWRKDSQKERRRQYRRTFLKQRLMGIAILAITMIAAKMLDGDATIALITVPLGLYLLFTKEMLLVNDFYRETKERDTEKKWYRY